MTKTNILASETSTSIQSTNAQIELNRSTNKANSEQINSGNIEIYALIIASFRDYKANKISIKDMNRLRDELSVDCGLAPSSVKKKSEKSQWVFVDLKAKGKLPRKGSNDPVADIKQVFAELGVTSEAKLVKHFDPNRKDQSEAEKLVEKILGRPSKNDGGWKGGLDADTFKEFEKVFDATKKAKDELNGKGEKAEKTKKEEEKIIDEVNQCSDILLASANAENQADLDNNPFG